MRRNQPEAAIQAAIVEALRLVLGRDYFVLHIPNGGKRSKTEAAILQGLGVYAGAPDLIIFRGGFIGCMEVKDAGELLSETQTQFWRLCLDRAVPTAIVRSLDDALAACVRWGLTTRAQDGALRALPPAGVGGVAREDCPLGRGDAGEVEAVRGVQGEGGAAAGVSKEVLHG